MPFPIFSLFLRFFCANFPIRRPSSLPSPRVSSFMQSAARYQVLYSASSLFHISFSNLRVGVLIFFLATESRRIPLSPFFVSFFVHGVLQVAVYLRCCSYRLPSPDHSVSHQLAVMISLFFSACTGITFPCECKTLVKNYALFRRFEASPFILVFPCNVWLFLRHALYHSYPLTNNVLPFLFF